MRILVVDDSMVMRKMIDRLVRAAGIDVTELIEANDGWEGLALVQSKDPDLILCDVNMPTMDGLEFLRNLKQASLPRRVPVVMITTEGSESRMAEAKASGAAGYIRKPFTVEQIKEQILPLLEAS